MLVKWKPFNLYGREVQRKKDLQRMGWHRYFMLVPRKLGETDEGYHIIGWLCWAERKFNYRPAGIYFGKWESEFSNYEYRTLGGGLWMRNAEERGKN
jgi:hypothetical protein